MNAPHPVTQARPYEAWRATFSSVRPAMVCNRLTHAAEVHSLRLIQHAEDAMTSGTERGTFDRRRLLRAAGMTGAAGVGAVVALPGRAAAHQQSVEAIDVQAHGATGDGSTDDWAAIQSALDEVTSVVRRKLLDGWHAQGACIARRRRAAIPGRLASVGNAARCVSVSLVECHQRTREPVSAPKPSGRSTKRGQ